jgi:hypothetical protein
VEFDTLGKVIDIAGNDHVKLYRLDSFLTLRYIKPWNLGSGAFLIP